MANFINTNTRETTTIDIVDPKSGKDCINELFQLQYDTRLKQDFKNDWWTDAETIDIFKSLTQEYKKALKLIHKIELYGTVSTKELLDEILQYNDGLHIELWANQIIKDIEENNMVSQEQMERIDISKEDFLSYALYIEKSRGYNKYWKYYPFKENYNEEPSKELWESVTTPKRPTHEFYWWLGDYNIKKFEEYKKTEGEKHQ